MNFLGKMRGLTVEHAADGVIESSTVSRMISQKTFSR
jgi:hypothetical protein